MMERYTKRRENGDAFVTDDHCFDTWARSFEGEAIDRLAYYEDLEEQGRLITLPCKVGDHVWVNGLLGCGVAEEHIVSDARWSQDKDGVECRFQADLVGTDGDSWCYFYASHVGQYVFLTREEAEKALEKGAELTEVWDFRWFDPCDIGKTVFLTREAAEKALEEGADHDKG